MSRGADSFLERPAAQVELPLELDERSAVKGEAMGSAVPPTLERHNSQVLQTTDAGDQSSEPEHAVRKGAPGLHGGKGGKNGKSGRMRVDAPDEAITDEEAGGGEQPTTQPVKPHRRQRTFSALVSPRVAPAAKPSPQLADGRVLPVAAETGRSLVSVAIQTEEREQEKEKGESVVDNEIQMSRQSAIRSKPTLDTTVQILDPPPAKSSAPPLKSSAAPSASALVTTSPALVRKQRRDGEYQLYVITLAGKTLALDVKATDTVDIIKAHVHEREGLLPTEQCLIFDHQLSCAIASSAVFDRTTFARCLQSSQQLKGSSHVNELLSGRSLATYNGLGDNSTIHLIPTASPLSKPSLPTGPALMTSPSEKHSEPSIWEEIESLKSDLNKAKQEAEAAQEALDVANAARAAAEAREVEAKDDAATAMEVAVADVQRLNLEVARLGEELETARAAEASSPADGHERGSPSRSASSSHNELMRTKTTRFVEKTIQMVEVIAATHRNSASAP